MQAYDLIAHLKRQRAFSRATFGPGLRTNMVSDHIRKELVEVAAEPMDVRGWADVVLLALDGFWRCADADNLPIELAVAHLEAKQTKNERRDWPDWRTSDPNKAIEHIDLTRTEAPAAKVTTPSHCPFTSCPSPYVCKTECRGLEDR